MPDPTLNYRRSHLHVDAVAVADIAGVVGTPVYIYSLRRILAQLQRLETAFAPLVPAFHYSLKANANGHIVRALVGAGCGCDAVSAGEIYLALRAGCPRDHIVFAGVGKTAAEMRYALQQGIGWFNVENTGELNRLDRLAAEAATKARVALRLNPALRANTHRHIATGHEGAKFGIALAEARQVLAARHSYPNLNIRGLHVHIGSQLGRPDESAEAARIAVALAHEFSLTHINLGGGFPVAYDGDRAVPLKDFAEALIPVLAGQGVEVAFEPGRYLVGEAGILLAEVQYLKQNGRTVVLDAGMNDLLRPALYDARHPIYAAQGEGVTGPVQIVGPICESADVVHPAAVLPPLQSGSLVAIGVAGAYGMTMTSNYNGRPRPAEVMVDGDRWYVIRGRETFEDLIRHETT